MALLIGQPIDGRELEQATSPWSPERFASLCDALAWAASGRQCPSLPSFTTRVNAKDGGIDAEWSVELPADSRPIPTPIVGPGWNVFQYKKRDLIAQDRRRVISGLKSSLAGALNDLVQEDKDRQPPNRYILFLNVDLKHNDKSALKESILQGYRDQSKLYVEIVGAAELAALLNNHPHLRAAYFAEFAFKTWGEAYEVHLNQKFMGMGIHLIGRQEELEQLRAFVEDPRVRLIILSGPHDIGKSCLALEATRHRPHDVVQALDPRSMDLSDYRNLCAAHGQAICIVEGPEPDSIESLVHEALSFARLKLIITLPTSANAPTLSYGRDERVQSLPLQPLTDEEARKLLEASGQPLDYEIEDWIISHAGGIPGVLLAAARVGHTIRRDLTGFINDVGHAFRRQIESALGQDALECARLFSILTHVGVSGSFESELKHICDLFGEGWTPHRALLSLADLERAGLARRGGSFAEITLPILANYLVSESLQGRLNEILALFGKLDCSGQVRFIRRLNQVKSEEVERFWDEVFAPHGLLGTFQKAFSNADLLQLVSARVPERTLRLLESGLSNSSREDRLAIAGNERRELMWTLEQLLFRARTSRAAMRLVWLLAEAETENFANNATGILAECFHPLHPQMPLSLQERIQLLREFTSSNSSLRGKLVAIEAVKEALNPLAPVLPLSHSTGLEPLDSAPAFKPEDFYEYCSHLVEIVFSLADGDDEVASLTLQVLPELTAGLGILGQLRKALEYFGRLVQWACSGKRGLDVSSLYGAIHHLQDELLRGLREAELPPERQNELGKCISDLNELRVYLETGDFTIRLKRWAGQWVYGDYEEVVSRSGHLRFETELQKLANEAVKNPSLLRTDLIAWLLSPASQRADVFFLSLGGSDAKLVFRERIETLGQQVDGTVAFSAYWEGWAKRDPEAAKKRLDYLANVDAVTGSAIVQASARLTVDQRAVNHVMAQIRSGRIDFEFAGRVLSASHWIEELSSAQFEQLLQAIVGASFDHAATAIHMIPIWTRLERPLQGGMADFAWRCLERDPPLKSSADAWDFDRLAARLAQSDPQRGFSFLEKLLQESAQRRHHWDPLNLYGGRQFWGVLHEINKEHLIGLLLNLAQRDRLTRSVLSRRLRQLLDQEEDHELLCSVARTDLEAARLVGSWITLAKPGFWPVAFELVKRYPHDEVLLSNLTAGLMHQGTAIWGPISQFYGAQKQEIERVLRETSTPPEVCAWLRDVMNRLERDVSRQIIWEYDEDVNDLQRYIQDKGSAQRMWAIGRVVKYASWEDIRRLLTVEDIEEALPQIDLPEKKRKMLEKALEVWRYGK